MYHRCTGCTRFQDQYDGSRWLVWRQGYHDDDITKVYFISTTNSENGHISNAVDVAQRERGRS